MLLRKPSFILTHLHQNPQTWRSSKIAGPHLNSAQRNAAMVKLRRASLWQQRPSLGCRLRKTPANGNDKFVDTCTGTVSLQMDNDSKSACKGAHTKAEENLFVSGQLWRAKCSNDIAAAEQMQQFPSTLQTPQYSPIVLNWEYFMLIQRNV